MAYKVDASEFTAFAGKLKAAERAVRNRMRKGLREAARPFAAEVVPEGAEAFPAGLAAHVVAKGGRPVVVQTSTGVRVVFGKKSGPQIGRMNEGSLRHPTFGRRPWVSQDIPAGSFTKALEKRLPDIRDAVGREVHKMMEELG